MLLLTNAAQCLRSSMSWVQGTKHVLTGRSPLWIGRKRSRSYLLTSALIGLILNPWPNQATASSNLPFFVAAGTWNNARSSWSTENVCDTLRWRESPTRLYRSFEACFWTRSKYENRKISKGVWDTKPRLYSTTYRIRVRASRSRDGFLQQKHWRRHFSKKGMLKYYGLIMVVLWRVDIDRWKIEIGILHSRLSTCLRHPIALNGSSK